MVTDPEIQAAIDRAIERLARRLSPVTFLKDPEAAARAFVEEDLLGSSDHWRPFPEPPGRRPVGSGKPPTPEFKQELARLHHTREDTP